MLQINKVGRIVEGEYQGWYIYLQPMEPESDDFLILISNMNEFGKTERSKSSEGYDIYAKDYQSAETIAKLKNWKISWLE